MGKVTNLLQQVTHLIFSLDMWHFLLFTAFLPYVCIIITESLRLETTSKIIESNHQPDLWCHICTSLKYHQGWGFTISRAALSKA